MPKKTTRGKSKGTRKINCQRKKQVKKGGFFGPFTRKASSQRGKMQAIEQARKAKTLRKSLGGVCGDEQDLLTNAIDIEQQSLNDFLKVEEMYNSKKKIHDSALRNLSKQKKATQKCTSEQNSKIQRSIRKQRNEANIKYMKDGVGSFKQGMTDRATRVGNEFSAARERSRQRDRERSIRNKELQEERMRIAREEVMRGNLSPSVPPEVPSPNSVMDELQ